MANDVAEALGYERPKDAIAQHCKGALKVRYPDMVFLRDDVLSSATELMALNEKFSLGLSISETIYGKYGTGGAA